MNKPRGRPFEPGNKYGRGRPKGSRNRMGTEAQLLLEQYSVSLVRKCIALALQGDVHAMRLCMERIMVARRERPIRLSLPTVTTSSDVAGAEQKVIGSICTGRITPAEGETLINILAVRRTSLETDELLPRVEALEKAHPQQ